MNKIDFSSIATALREDIGRGDVTTRLVLRPGQKARAEIIAKSTGVACGVDLVRRVFKTVDQELRFQALVKDAGRIKKNQVLARITGKAESILKAERVALNFLARLSGIATLTAKYVQSVKPYKARIMDTRKTTPGLRILEKYAVRCGRGYNHRLGLWDQILIKDNHIALNRSVSLFNLINQVKRRRPKGMSIEVEVKDLAEFRQAFNASPDIIMLDNFNLAKIKKALRIRKAKKTAVVLEVSGGVTLKNVRAIAATGVERISIGD